MKKLVCMILAMLLLAGCGAQQAESTTSAPTEPTWDGLYRVDIQGEEVVFAPWEQEGLPAEGCYYLTGDVVLTEAVTVAGQLKLHLNGHTVTGVEEVDYGSLFTVPAGGELVIYDAPENAGSVVSPRSFTGRPTVMHMFSVSGTVTLAGGTVDASAISLEDISNGAGFYVKNGGVLNVCGGTLIGGSVLCYSLTPQVEETVPEETGEQETEQEATEPKPVELLGKGGSVYLEKGAKCCLSAGSIQDGVAGLGGNIYIDGDEEGSGELQITGGTVFGGEAMFHGGNMYVLGTVSVSDGEIVEGRSYGNGGNVFLEGTLEMTGGALRAGRCDYNSMSGRRGANLLVNGKNAVVHISNAEIIDGDGHGSENFGGNICVMGQCAREFTITDSTISGGQGHRGGNVYFGTLAKDVDPENLDFYMCNVTISGGTCSYRGANLCMDSDLRGVYVELVMDNCSILLEDATRETISLGAGAAIDTWANLTMNGGSIEGGTLTIYADATLTTNGSVMTTDIFGGAGSLVINP